MADTAADHLARALEHHRAGRLPDAEQAYRDALLADPNVSAVAYNNLGAICRSRGDMAEALELYQAAARLMPDYVAPHQNLGFIFERSGRHGEALAAYRRAAEIEPGQAENWFRVGVAATNLGETDVAIGHFRHALTLGPTHATAWFNLATLLAEKRELTEAETCYRRALESRPRFVEAAKGLAVLMMRMRRMAEAEALLREILAWQADYVPALVHLGSILLQKSNFSVAEGLFRRALERDPKSGDARYGLGQSIHLQGRQEEAVAVLEGGSAAGDQGLRLQYALPFFRLPTAYRDDAHIEQVRAAYEADLKALAAGCDASADHRRQAADWAGDLYPYHLAYQQKNDRDLQAILGRMTVESMAERYPRFASRLPMPPRDGSGRIRLGVACGLFRLHTVWKLFRGWFRRIDRSRFETFAYQTGRQRDELTAEIAGMFDHTADLLDLPFDAAAARVRSDDLHLLFYPEIGMDPLSVRLAALRLAPIQCASFGHPETTGLSTLDHFVSADLMEAADADSHYTEPLVRLPGIGLCYDPLPLTKAPVDLGQLGIGPDDVVYLCCQNHMKYLARHDGIFPAIAATVPHARFVFLDPGGASRFRERLTRAFARAGLPADRHIIFLPKLSQEQFLGLNDASHVFLDSIGWSGGNTTFEALLAGLPIVTLPTDLMRGRVSYALLAAMDMTETVARSVDDYVAIAVRLGNDPAWRKACAQKVVDRRSRVLNDASTVRDFENFVTHAVEARTRV